MASIRCTVTLLSDKNRKVDIEIIKEKNGSLLWKEIKASGGNLHLSAASGTWETNYGDMLTLWYTNSGVLLKKHPNMKTLITLVAFDIKENFFDDIVNNGSKLETDNAGLYNDIHPKKKFRANWHGCVERIADNFQRKVSGL